MSIDLSAFLFILTESPGDLIYHLVIGLSLILLVGVASSKLSRSTIGRRAWHVWIGGLILLLLQILLFYLRYCDDQPIGEFASICIMVEHVISAMMVVWLVWTFLETGRHYLFTCLDIVVTLALISFGVISALLVFIGPGFLSLNTAMIWHIWRIATLVMILSGMILILIKRDGQWVVGTLILILLAAGYTLQLILPTERAAFMGVIRLAQIVSFPWMITLAQRFVKPPARQEPQDKLTAIKDEDKLVDIKPALMDSLLKIHTQETSADRFKAIVQALSLSVAADICFLAQIPEEGNSVSLTTGYDLIRERFLEPRQVNRNQLPRIMEAWEANQVLRLSQADINTLDAATLTSLMNYHRIGNLLAYPLYLKGQTLPVGGVIFLSPYTDKQWGEEIVHQLKTIEKTLTQVAFTPNIREKLRDALDEAQKEIIFLQKEKGEILQTLAEKETTIKRLNMEIQKLRAKYQIDRFEQIQQADRMKERIIELSAENAAKKELAARLAQLNEKMRQLTQERDQFNAALEKAEAKLKEMESQAGQTGPIRLSMENQIITLDSIAANARLGIAPQLQQKQINLEIINPDGRQTIKTDPELLQTVLEGLLENAVLASPPGQVIHLDQKLSFETGMLIIQITDHGEGLTPNDQKNLFSAEYDSIQGIGTVSSIRNAVRAIRILNGKIWLRSKKTAFTTFRVQLPVRIID